MAWASELLRLIRPQRRVETALQLVEERAGARLADGAAAGPAVWPRISFSIANSAAIRSSASLAIGEPSLGGRRRACAGRGSSRRPRPAGLGRSPDRARRARRSRHRRRHAGSRGRPQQRLGMLALAVGRVAVEGGRRRGRCPRPLVADEDPEPAGLGLAAARDRAPAPACRRHGSPGPARAWRPIASARGGQQEDRGRRPSRPGSTGRARRRPGRRSRSAGAAADDRHIWRSAHARAAPGPGRPRSIGKEGTGAWLMVSQARQLMRGRTWRTTLK